MSKYTIVSNILSLIFLALFFITEDSQFAVTTILFAIFSAEHGVKDFIEKGRE